MPSMARRCGFKIRFVAHVVLDWNSKKIRRDDGPIFALNRGRPDERYEAKIQQSTIYTFEYTSWARVAALLEGSECCGSLTSTSLQRNFFEHFVSLFYMVDCYDHDISCCTFAVELKLSHTKRMGIGRPSVCPYLSSAPCISGSRGPPW